MSVPRVNGTLLVATAAAEPPLDPPVNRSGAHGLWVGPHDEMWFVPLAASSCMLVLPMMIAPASRSRATANASADAMLPRNASQHPVVSCPATSNSSLTSTGMPCSRPTGSVASASAAARASSAKTWLAAFVTGCHCSMERIASMTSSAGVTWPPRSAELISASVTGREGWLALAAGAVSFTWPPGSGRTGGHRALRAVASTRLGVPRRRSAS